jgi:hypothetical protein
LIIGSLDGIDIPSPNIDTDKDKSIISINNKGIFFMIVGFNVLIKIN